MSKILIFLVHPSLEKSKANQMLLDSIPNSQDITLHDLYEEYPGFTINVKAEQNLIETHDILLFQHPLYWYSCPPLMKLWIDLVLEDGWAYGRGGNQLLGKKWVQVITTGGSKEAYTKGGFHGFTTDEFLLPFRRTAELCGMEYLQPFLVQGTFELNELDLQKESNRYLLFINSLLGGIYG
ncbi:sodium:proton antiporter [Leptospira brenneri]|uniref:Sodium:proton antiporter n=1 Tax=Leptospira brenneri TaxID=2023182 RepID=A0A5F1Z4N0_9LEPT|nr:NAD(P)H-dependent oxidoreductase [Leptospira brenneri]TGK92102.1 sodium:proton antiporter [Leptospira brenneri]